MKLVVAAALATVLSLYGAETKPQPSAKSAPASATKELNYEELDKLLEQKDKIFLLDVRSAVEIALLGSVPGYVNIPLDELEGRLKEVPKDKLVVTL